MNALLLDAEPICLIDEKLISKLLIVSLLSL